MIAGEAQPQPLTPETVKADVGRWLADLVREVRQRRDTREQQWLRNHAAWHAKSIGREQYKSDVFRHYLPVLRRAVERMTIRATKSLLPSPQFFEVYPGDELDLLQGRSADAVRAFHYYLLTERIKVRQLAQMLMRTTLLYEQSIVKTGVQVIDAPVMWGGYAGAVQEVWPHARAVDPFNFYVWPETVSGISEAMLVFEDIMMPYQEYQLFAQRGVCDPINRSDLGKPEWPRHHIERLQHLGFTSPAERTGAGIDQTGEAVERTKPQEGFVALTECWPKIGGRFWQVWLVWNVNGGPRVTRLHMAPYPYPPYRQGTLRPLPGELYTSSLGDDLEPFQILFNDQVNQGEEARAISATPPTIVDPAFVTRTDQFKWGSREKWYLPPDAVNVLKIPDVSINSLRAQQQTLALLNSIGGQGGMAEGQPTRGLPRAGFAVTSLISLAMADTEDPAEMIEQECLTPMLGDLHRWTLAFVPRWQIMSVPGAREYPPRTLTIQELFGNWHFRWVGTLQARDQQVRAQRLLAALDMLGKSEERLMLQGFMINWPALIRMTWRDGLGERGVEQIVVPMSPEVRQMLTMQQQARVAQGEQGGGQAGAPGNTEEAFRQMSRGFSESSVGETTNSPM